jgi:hypothetical protein
MKLRSAARDKSCARGATRWPVRLPETAREKIAAKTALNNSPIRMSAVHMS